MASSDDEGVIVPQTVTDYYFEDKSGAPISFYVLPFHWDDVENLDAVQGHIFLRGTTDGGLQKVYKPVIAWKLGLDEDHPEVSVLLKDKNWIKLLKPRKIYEETTARTVLITIHLLHFLRKKPESSEKSLWSHLDKVFSFEDKASEDDLRGNQALIRQFVERDSALEKSQLLPMFLKEGPKKRISGEDIINNGDAKKTFIDDDEVDDIMMVDDGDAEEESYLFDSVCAICDNGGELLCCEGKCLRSFHATKSAGIDSECRSLGYTSAQVEAIQNFYCKNCQYNQHQCFACGKLGSSDKALGAEVFLCINARCGYFYHPKCAAQLLHPKNEAEATECQKNITSGESFMCPVHKCFDCHKEENKDIKDLQFAVCRRCPKSFHRQCLPREITFVNDHEHMAQRAWEDLLPNRILLYCLDHEIVDELGTPKRNHLRFPEIIEKQKVTDVQERKLDALLKKKMQDFDGLSRDRTSIKSKKVADKLSGEERRHSLVKLERIRKDNLVEPAKKPKPLKGSVSEALDSRKVSLAATTSVVKKSKSLFPVIDAETEKKVMYLREKASASLTLDHIIRMQTMPSTYAYSGRHIIDKGITHGKVEGFVEAVRTALKKLQDGGKVEDAKAVCEPAILRQLLIWNSKLRVYLAPFLHGARYTSFGRHFTKLNKLVEIVDTLQWYVHNDDMIVDFCCGSNDFSLLMKEKMDAVGKKCSFQNYDVIQPKNDFCFERRDWMTVEPKELPNGSQLIMGLNPPFGVKASLANKFIDKALSFCPKLIILIVPPETERLDRKHTPYDLIWEDTRKLAGKSFYLPGSVDENEKQMDQSNNTAPVLYLWSRRDWTLRHRAIALNSGHKSHHGIQSENPVDVNKRKLSGNYKENSPNMDISTPSRKLPHTSGNFSGGIDVIACRSGEGRDFSRGGFDSGLRYEEQFYGRLQAQQEDIPPWRKFPSGGADPGQDPPPAFSIPQMYASRPGDSNYLRPSGPLSGMGFAPRPQQPYPQSCPGFAPRPQQPYPQPCPGFAPRPQQPYPGQGSAGWPYS